MPSSRYAGRHRPTRDPRRTLRSVGLGLALPAGAAATLVLSDPPTAGADTAAAMTLTGVGGLDTGNGDAAEGTALAVGTRDEARAEVAARAADRARATLLDTEQAKRAKLAKQGPDTAKVVSLLTTDEGAPGSHAWVKPVAGYVLTSKYGMRWGALHPAQDLALPNGSPVRALSTGTVLSAGWAGGFGNRLVIEYWDGTVSWYAHLSGFEVKPGDTVNAGQVVARSGNTGHSTGPHLHLEIYVDGAGKTDQVVYGTGTVVPAAWFAAKGLAL